MAAVRRKKALVGPRGPRGRQGKIGKTGPPGPAANGDLKQLAAQVQEIVKELHVQLTRIAQIQAQLDRLALTWLPVLSHRSAEAMSGQSCGALVEVEQSTEP